MTQYQVKIACDADGNEQQAGYFPYANWEYETSEGSDSEGYRIIYTAEVPDSFSDIFEQGLSQSDAVISYEMVA